MTIIYKTGNLFEGDYEAIVITVNCVGVAGRGIALQSRNIYPTNYMKYAEACGQDRVHPGRLFITETGARCNPRYIINFPTKRHWRDKSRLMDIELGLIALADKIRTLAIRTIAIPPLGAGLGCLNWGLVRGRIKATLEHIKDTRITVFAPWKGQR